MKKLSEEAEVKFYEGRLDGKSCIVTYFVVYLFNNKLSYL